MSQHAEPLAESMPPAKEETEHTTTRYISSKNQKNQQKVKNLKKTKKTKYIFKTIIIYLPLVQDKNSSQTNVHPFLSRHRTHGFSER